MTRTSIVAALAAALLLVAPHPASARIIPVEMIESGSFRIYRGDQPLGTENFSLTTRGDSMLVFSRVQLFIAGPSDTVAKTMTLIASLLDFDLHHYESEQTHQGHSLRRGLVMDDTLFTAYREQDQIGSATRLIRPPGKIYVEDPQLFVLYDLICRNLIDEEFDQRPIQMLVLGEADTVMEATVTDLGKEPYRWGARTLSARKLDVTRSDARFTMWLSPKGQLLKLEQPEYGLLVVRDPPKRPRPAPKPRHHAG
jgi:hypothetical protein